MFINHKEFSIELIKRILFTAIVLLPYAYSVNSALKVALSAILLFSILLILKRRWVLIFVGGLFIFTGFLQLIYTVYAGGLIDEYYWIASVSANVNETISFVHALGLYDIASYIGYVTSSLFLLLSINVLSVDFSRLGGVVFIAFTFVVTYLYGFGKPRIGEVIKLSPAYIVTSYIQAKRSLNSLIVHTTPKLKRELPLADDIYVFLGESATKLRMSSYGYEMDTTPNLKDKKWMKFDDYVANGLNTQPNLKAFFSGKVMNASESVGYDFIRAAKDAGYKVIYIDNNKYQNVDPIYAISAQADRYISLNGLGATSAENDDRIKHDIEMEPYIDDALSGSQRKLVIVHFAGSHPSQVKRYPSNFDIFGNAYDNSIAYTDYLIGRWADRIDERTKNRAVVMLYLSDHGAKVPPGCGLGKIFPSDYNSYGADDRYFSNVAVPFFVRFNARFRQINQKFIEYAESHKSDKLDHTVIFPTLTRLMGYTYIQNYDFDRSLFLENKHVMFERINTNGQDIDSLINQGKVCRN